MAVLSIESSITVTLGATAWTNYLDARNSDVASSVELDGASLSCGQAKVGGAWTVFRGGMVFDLSGLPSNANITGVTLKIYGSADLSDTDFVITPGAVVLSSPPVFSDFAVAKWESSYGTMGSFNTSGFATVAYNDIALDASGLSYINASLQSGEVKLGLRSSKDYSTSAPTQNEYVTLGGQTEAGDNLPVLEVTFSNWPNEQYPEVLTFPVAGKIDLATLGQLSAYMTALDRDLSAISDPQGNISLAEDKWILWTSTSQKIAYDSGNDWVTFTTLNQVSLTLDGDLATADLTMSNNAAAVDCTVANDAQLSDTAYATLKSKITDNEVVFSAIAAPTPADDEGDIYMDSTTGDLMLKTRDDGQAGTKTDTLIDFSGL